MHARGVCWCEKEERRTSPIRPNTIPMLSSLPVAVLPVRGGARTVAARNTGQRGARVGVRKEVARAQAAARSATSGWCKTVGVG